MKCFLCSFESKYQKKKKKNIRSLLDLPQYRFKKLFFFRNVFNQIINPFKKIVSGVSSF